MKNTQDIKDKKAFKMTKTYECVAGEMLKNKDTEHAMNVLSGIEETANNFSLVASYIKGDSTISESNAVKALEFLHSTFAFDQKLFTKIGINTAMHEIKYMKTLTLKAWSVFENIIIVDKSLLEASTVCAEDAKADGVDISDVYSLIHESIGITSILDQAQQTQEI